LIEKGNKQEMFKWTRGLHGSAAIGFSAMALLTCASPAQANQIIVNGSFELTTNGSGQFDSKTTATGWTSSGYNFIFASGTADTTGATGDFGNLKLWGPNDGSANGLPASSPDGGNYVAADGAFEIGAITQTVNGLIVGNSYNLSFFWAAAQQSGFNGATTEQWKVSLGGQEEDTPVLNNANHGFTGLKLETFSYTATATSEVLSFLSVGTPNGVPPFALLDGVSLTTPEPGTCTLIGIGLLGIPIARKLLARRLRKGSAKPPDSL
jgi:hypothetical protein